MVQTSFKFKSVHWYSLATAALVVLAIGCGASDGGDASAEGGDEENLVTPVAPLISHPMRLGLRAVIRSHLKV